MWRGDQRDAPRLTMCCMRSDNHPWPAAASRSLCAGKAHDGGGEAERVHGGEEELLLGPAGQTRMLCLSVAKQPFYNTLQQAAPFNWGKDAAACRQTGGSRLLRRLTSWRLPLPLPWWDSTSSLPASSSGQQVGSLLRMPGCHRLTAEPPPCCTVLRWNTGRQNIKPGDPLCRRRKRVGAQHSAAVGRQLRFRLRPPKRAALAAATSNSIRELSRAAAPGNCHLGPQRAGPFLPPRQLASATRFS